MSFTLQNLLYSLPPVDRARHPQGNVHAVSYGRVTCNSGGRKGHADIFINVGPQGINSHDARLLAAELLVAAAYSETSHAEPAAAIQALVVAERVRITLSSRTGTSESV